VVSEYDTGTGLVNTTHNIFNQGNSTIYFPSVKYQYYNMTTGIRIQNTGTANAAITAEFRNGDGTVRCSLTSSTSIPAGGGWGVPTSTNCPGANLLGTIIATSSQPIVGMANEASQSGQVTKKAYSSFENGKRTLIAPIVYGDQANWRSGIQVQNTYSLPAHLSLCYYEPSGSTYSNCTLYSINAYGQGIYFPPAGFTGSLRIASDRLLVATINIVNKAAYGDTHSMYNFSSR
jgi:hypothetical protein